MNPVQVDWVSVVLGPVVVVSMVIALIARRRRSAPAAGGGPGRLPTWGLVAQTVGVASALFLGFVQIVWGA